jgi:hypothetical protein
VRKLLVNIGEMRGFAPPSVGRRYFLAQEAAEAAGGDVRLALVVSPEMIDPQMFTVKAAANMGLVMNAFTSEPDALAWLSSTGTGSGLAGDGHKTSTGLPG